MDLLDLLNPIETYDNDGEGMDNVPKRVVPRCSDDTMTGEPTEAAFAARSLMMLCSKQSEPKIREVRRGCANKIAVPISTSFEPGEAMYEASESVRSPVLLASYMNSFHMSPIAHKIGNAAWKSSPSSPRTLGVDPSQMETRTSEVASHFNPGNLKRRLSSFQDTGVTSSSDTFVSPGEQPFATDRTYKRSDDGVYCSVTGCLRSPIVQGKCSVHKGMKLCQVGGCRRPVQSRGCCKSHGGGARCKQPGCSKGAISKGRCRSHGGGTRCAVPDCSKWAQRLGCCVRHSKTETSKI